MKEAGCLIIGGDSLLGRNIARALKKLRKRVLTTSRREPNLSESCVFFDLSRDNSTWEIPDAIETAFICAAVTSMEKCRRYPEESRKINVHNTVALASMLAAREIAVVFFSTNLVFDGQSPFRKADDAPNALVEYGRQKADAERGLMGLGRGTTIVRLTKVLSPGTGLLSHWINSLKNKVAVHPFCNMPVSPIAADFASSVIIEIAQRRSSGIWQISGGEDITYEELARYLARRMGIAQRYVQPIEATASETGFEAIPKHTTLDTARVRDELGYRPPGAWDTIDSLYDAHYVSQS